MSDADARTQRRQAAVELIAACDYVVCACGEMFYDADRYIDHVDACPISQRYASAAAEWSRT